MQCAQCQFDNPPNMRFCGRCGSQLVDISAASGAVTDEVSAAPGAERRHVTLMFIDVVNYMSLSEQLDPEVLRDVMLQFQTCSADVIQRFEGYIGKYLGDGELGVLRISRRA